MSMQRKREKNKIRPTGVESRWHFVISRLVVNHPLGWGVGGVLGCLRGGIPLGDGCDGGRNARDARDARDARKVGTKLAPDTLRVPLVCPSGPKQMGCEWQVERVR
jgi:hypothetical protein